MSSDPVSGVNRPRHAAPTPDPHSPHEAIAAALRPPPPRSSLVPPLLRDEAEGLFAGAMWAYAAGDLAGARLTLLAVAGIGDPGTAPAAMVFLGVIGYRRRNFPEAYLWFARASAGPDEHWARVADVELRRLG